MTEAPSDRVRVRRLGDRGNYDQADIREILAAAPIAHMGVNTDQGPIVLPMAFGVGENDMYLHGAAANAILKEGRSAEVCVTVTHVDGLVLARSVFHHSMNYRSVVIRGEARNVTDPDERWESLKIITDHITPGRWGDARVPDDTEMLATSVLAVPLTEASAKVRTGPPSDDEVDMSVGCWAGVVPMTPVWGDPIDSPDLADGIGRPDYLPTTP